MLLLARVYQQNLEIVILYSSVLFIPENRRENGILCLLVITRGLPDSIGSEDTWRVNSPSSGRSLLIWSVVLGEVVRVQPPRFAWGTPGRDEGSAW